MYGLQVIETLWEPWLGYHTLTGGDTITYALITKGHAGWGEEWVLLF